MFFGKKLPPECKHRWRPLLSSTNRYLYEDTESTTVEVCIKCKKRRVVWKNSVIGISAVCTFKNKGL